MAQPPEADLAGAASHTPQAEALAGVGWLSSGGADPLSYRGEELGQVVKLFEFHHALGFLLIPLAVTYVLVLRCVFKSWTLNGAAASYKAGDSFEDRYRMAFDRRAELESQLHWARERGDAASATTIQQQRRRHELTHVLGKKCGKTSLVSDCQIDHSRRRHHQVMLFHSSAQISEVLDHCTSLLSITGAKHVLRQPVVTRQVGRAVANNHHLPSVGHETKNAQTCQR